MSFFRPDVDRLAGYTPGEQPQDSGWVKLNTNENPYPPSPHVLAAIESTARNRLNIYPDPLATPFRNAAAKVLGLSPDSILPANGSDEVLTLLFRSFLDAGELVAFPYPSYILYETLAEIQGAAHERILLNPDWSWNWGETERIVSRAKLVIVPNPNSPSGNRWSFDDLERLVPPGGILVVDEAYGDFCERPHQLELLRGPLGKQIIITRTLSKSYSLAGLRLGYAIADPELIAGMRKVKDSYNCDALSIAGGAAAIEDQPHMFENRRRILQTRSRLTAELRKLGFTIVDSDANFVWTTHPSARHKETYQFLKERKILVRYMRFPGISWKRPDGLLDGLRITVGTDEQIDTFLKTLATLSF